MADVADDDGERKPTPGRGGATCLDTKDCVAAVCLMFSALRALALVAALVLPGAADAKAGSAKSGIVTSTRRDCPIECPEMVLIPPGQFIMGSPVNENGRDHQEGPRHRVKIGYGFLVGKYDVTVGGFAAFVTDAKYEIGPCKDNAAHSWRNPGFEQTDKSPVVCVNFNDAQAYAGWLSKRTGRSYRLLSESEHEYVSRAGTNTAFWWGAHAGKDNANCQACGSAWDGKGTAPVGSFRPNRFGLYDTSGNVFGWVSDCWSDTYDNATTDGTPNRQGDCSLRGLRGGGWGSGLPHVRIAFRLADPLTSRYDNMGFRIARSL